jgi:hypothetical protein
MAHLDPGAAGIPPLGVAPPVAGGAPVVAPVAEPGIPPVAVAASRTYREYYLERGNVPTPDRVAGYLAGYSFTDAGGAGVPTPANLRDLTVTLSDRQSMARVRLVFGAGSRWEERSDYRSPGYPYRPQRFSRSSVGGYLGMSSSPVSIPLSKVPSTEFRLVERRFAYPR